MRMEKNIVYDENSNAWFGESLPLSREDMLARVWRFDQLTPSPRAFLDCTLPGHVRTLYSALGHGSDDENLAGTAVTESLNYHIDFVKAEPDNGAALHSHGSEETFVALSGQWEVFWGDQGDDKTVLEPFDGIVVPPGVLRGFRNCSDSEALLLVVLGAHNAGHCVWSKTLQEPFARVVGQGTE